MTSTDNLLKTGCYGIAREIVVQPLIYPLEVIKIRQQSSNESVYQIFRKMDLYRGFTLQISKIVIKPLWRWPLMTEIPKAFSSQDPLVQQAIAGLTIATVDAAITTPLERWKVNSAMQKDLSVSQIYKDGWKGSHAYWLKLSVHWVAFLVAQKMMRDRISPGKHLTFSEAIIAGTQVAIIVSVVAAPFDLYNTMKQTQNSQKLKPKILYRGWPINALSLIIQNVASVYFIDLLNVG